MTKPETLPAAPVATASVCPSFVPWLLLATVLCACSRVTSAGQSEELDAQALLPRATGQLGWEEILRGGVPGRDSPTAGEDAAVAYDVTRKRLLLFGGKDDADECVNELWTFGLDSRKWTRVPDEEPWPPPREDHSLVLDAANDQLILFGGENGDTSNETWTYDLEDGRWEQVTDAGAPFLEAHVALYDPRGKRMIVFGGMTIEDDKKRLEKRTWALDLDASSHRYLTWSVISEEDQSGPPPRREHRGVYDPGGHRILVFGGRQRSSDSFLDDLWAFDLTTDSWREIETSGDRPTPVRQMAFTYDPEANELTSFGGEVLTIQAGDEKQYIVNQIWVLDLETGRWTDRTPYPPSVYDHVGIFVPEYGGTLIYGGSSFRSHKEHSTWLLRRLEPRKVSGSGSTEDDPFTGR